MRIPRLLTARFRLANTMKYETAQQSIATCWKTVSVTGISRWLQEKQAPKVLSSFFLQNASISQTQKHRWTSMGAKLAIH